jgi:hypothetical protein
MGFDTLNQVKNTKTYSGIWQKVDKKNVLVWHTRLGHLSLPDIQHLPNTINGIQFHARSLSACYCEGCIVGMMFWRPFQPLTSEDKANPRLLELVHSHVLGPMHSQTTQGYRYIIMFPNHYTRYSEVYFITLKLEAPGKFKE